MKLRVPVGIFVLGFLLVLGASAGSLLLPKSPPPQDTPELRLRALGPRYRDHLSSLMLQPLHSVHSQRLPLLISEQQALSRELEAIVALPAPETARRALRDAAELDRMFASWLEATAENAENEETAKQLLSLAERYYGSADQAFERLTSIAPPE